jgi:hypothetical protein
MKATFYTPLVAAVQADSPQVQRVFQSLRSAVEIARGGFRPCEPIRETGVRRDIFGAGRMQMKAQIGDSPLMKQSQRRITATWDGKMDCSFNLRSP